MASNTLSLYQSVMLDRQLSYNAAIASGRFEPFIYPWDAMPGLILFLSIMFIPRLPRQYGRTLSLFSFGIIVVLCLATLTRARTLNFASGYGTGLICAWGTIMTVVLLLINDPAKDFQRIEIAREHSDKESTLKEHGHEANGSAKTTAIANGTVMSRNTSTDIPASQQRSEADDTASATSYELIWRGHPSSIFDRIDWTFDLMSSFRGPNWNFRIPSMPAIDVPVPKYIAGKASPTPTKRINIPASTLHTLQRRAVINFASYYLLLDFLKTVMITDPYFLGLAPLTSPTPWPWLAQLTTHLPIATKSVRLTLSLTGVFSALSFIFSLSPLFFTLIAPTLHLTHLTRSPLLAPWLYPPYNASALTILDAGLPGFWGSFWHQLFRYGISAPSTAVLKCFNIPRKTPSARIFQVLTAFALSGLIHACASHTTFPPNPSNPPRPLAGPFAFFLLQGIGVIAQSLFARLFSTHISDTRTWPTPLRRSLNALFVGTWLYHTGPLLADDFARCGIWLFEPVPLSLLRGIGLGDGKGGWWCWGVLPGERWLGWWWDERWWRRGIAIY